MFPLRDLLPPAAPPVTSRALVVVCAIVFVVSLSDLESALLRYGAIAQMLTGAAPDGPLLVADDGRSWLRVWTHMFLHADWFHLIMNLWFLWIFGDNVEARVGRVRFVAFYLVCGLAALGAQVLAQPGFTGPMIGASGAISGVLGAYLVFFPRAKVQTLLILGFFVTVVVLPASAFLVYWFVLQLIGGAMDRGGGGGVAFFAHAGGFVAGVVGALLSRFWAPVKKPRRIEVKWDAPGDRRRLR